MRLELKGRYVRDRTLILLRHKASLRFERPVKHVTAGTSGENYRSSDSIARFLSRTLPFELEPANPLPGLGYGVTPYADAADQPKLIGKRWGRPIGLGGTRRAAPGGRRQVWRG